MKKKRVKRPLPYVSVEARQRAVENGRLGGKKKYARMSEEERHEFQSTITAAAAQARKEKREKK
jgi:hypothetical protein